MCTEHSAIIKSASLVVCAIDDFTDKVVSGSNIIVQAGDCKAHRKADGYYVFINLPSGRHVVSIQSDIYFPKSVEVDLTEINRINPVIYIRLKPNTVYPVPPRATCIRGSAGIGGRGEGGLSIILEHVSDVQAVKIAQDSVKAGSKAFKLYKAGNVSLEGMEFTVLDKEEEKKEQIKVIGTDDEAVMLEKGLQFGHKRGTPLIPYYSSQTDDKGCFMLLLKQPSEEEQSVKLHFQGDGIDKVHDVAINSGEIINTGKIELKE